MFEITGDDISDLDDTDLRTLVGLLCEADLRSANLPVAGVTWGGDQDAPDGGIDVRVELSVPTNPDSFVPRSSTGFQVKKPDMPRAKILKEMRPDGSLRPVIRELAEVGGAYIVVSSSGSTSDSALRNRRRAMAEAIRDLEDADSLKLEFYDRGRLATWVRTYPGLVVWLKEKIGRSMKGWQPYKNWANAPGGIQEEYLLDDHVRLHDGANPNAEGLSAVCGIVRLREVLCRPGSAVRLVGLSGIGKTRLLQALFDDRIGDRALDPAVACYTDVAEKPKPDPRSFADRLIASQRRAILVVDNCPPDLHRLLASLSTASGSAISLITVEYDVRDDQPERTDVFRLEPASIDLVEKLIRKRFAHIGKVDAGRISAFSGGNARIAIALANTVLQGETLTGLKDDDLFQRLFMQRHESNDALLRSAEVCSLVYSFEGESTSDPHAEICILGSLVDQSGAELFRSVAELMRRDLVQRRGKWRAVLPQALANALAGRALENLPRDAVIAALVNGGSERLLKSFSRRLSFLHECRAAVEIVNSWLSEGNILSDLRELNQLGITLLQNVAPVAPDRTLAVIEAAADGEKGKSFTTRENSNYRQFTRLLRSLAYTPALFDRCVNVLLRFALAEAPNENANSTREILRSLFSLYLSGTHAPSVQRIAIIERLAGSPDSEEQQLGLLLLDAALEAWHFNSSYSFDFGARPRDYGFAPMTREEIDQWYGAHIRLAESLAISKHPLSQNVKLLIAKKFRGLWTKGQAFDELERVATSISQTGSWNDGWIAVRTTLRFDAKGMEARLVKRLEKLEKQLAPTSLIEQARTYALAGHWSLPDLADVEDGEDATASARYNRAEEMTRHWGEEVAKDENVFRELLPDLVIGQGGRLASFGRGLADGASNPKTLWRLFRRQLAASQPMQRNYQAVCSFLHAVSERDPTLSEQWLDEAVNDSVLGDRFPVLQASIEITDRGVERLLEALSVDVAPIWTYRQLAYGRATTNLNSERLSDLLRAITSKPNGNEIAVEILYMRFQSDSDENQAHDERLVDLGRDLVSGLNFSSHSKRHDVMDYELGKLVSTCFLGAEAANSARVACRNFARALSENRVYAMDYPNFLRAIARVQPLAVLHELLDNRDAPDYRRMRILADDLDQDLNPLVAIPDKVIVDWCDMDPDDRYPVVASAIVAFRQSDDGSAPQWTPLALTLLERAPDVAAVMSEFRRAFRPMTWSGSRADIMEKRVKLLGELTDHNNADVARCARDEELAFRQEIQSEREWEARNNRAHDQGFE